MFKNIRFAAATAVLSVALVHTGQGLSGTVDYSESATSLTYSASNPQASSMSQVGEPPVYRVQYRQAASNMTPAGNDKTVYRVRYFDKDAKSKFSAGPWFSDEKAYAKSRSLSQNNRIRLKSIRIQSLTPGNDSWQKVAD